MNDLKNTLSKAMQSLQTHKIISSSQGLKGGYTLKKDLNEISFYDFLEALGEIKRLTCHEKEECTLFKNCTISSPLLKWEKKAEQYLRETNLAELIENTPAQKQPHEKEALCL